MLSGFIQGLRLQMFFCTLAAVEVIGHHSALLWSSALIRISLATLQVQLKFPMDCSLVGSSVYGKNRQEHWSGLPFPSPGHLPNPGIEPGSPSF